MFSLSILTSPNNILFKIRFPKHRQHFRSRFKSFCHFHPEFQLIAQKNDEYLIVASDGIWEFMTNQQCMDIVTAASSLEDACEKIVTRAYQLWITNEVRTDDITAIIVKVMR